MHGTMQVTGKGCIWLAPPNLQSRTSTARRIKAKAELLRNDGSISLIRKVVSDWYTCAFQRAGGWANAALLGAGRCLRHAAKALCWRPNLARPVL